MIDPQFLKESITTWTSFYDNFLSLSGPSFLRQSFKDSFWEEEGRYNQERNVASRDLLKFYQDAGKLGGIELSSYILEYECDYDLNRIVDVRVKDTFEEYCIDVKHLSLDTRRALLEVIEGTPDFENAVAWPSVYCNKDSYTKQMMLGSPSKLSEDIPSYPTKALFWDAHCKGLVALYKKLMVCQLVKVLKQGEGLVPIDPLYRATLHRYEIISREWKSEILRLKDVYSEHPKADSNSKGRFNAISALVNSYSLLDRDWFRSSISLQSVRRNDYYISAHRNNDERLRSLGKEINAAFELLTQDDFGVLRSLVNQKPSLKLFKKILWVLQTTEDPEYMKQVMIPYVTSYFKSWPASCLVMDSYTKYDPYLCSLFVKVWEVKESKHWTRLIQSDDFGAEPEYLRISANHLKFESFNVPAPSVKGIYLASRWCEEDFRNLITLLPNLKSVCFLEKVHNYSWIQVDVEKYVNLYERVLEGIPLVTTGSITNHINETLKTS